MPASVLQNARRLFFVSVKIPPLKMPANLQWKLEVDMLCQTKTQMLNLNISLRNGSRAIWTTAMDHSQ